MHPMVARCLLLLLLLLPMPAGAGALREIRMAEHDDFTRVVLELESEAHYRISNLSDKHRTVVVEFYGITAAPSSVALTNQEKRLTSPQVNFDGTRKWLSLHLKTDGPVSLEDYTLRNPLRVVVDARSGSGAAAPARAPEPEQAPGKSDSIVEAPAAVVPGGWKRRIIIDPGHGGHHKGGWGKLSGRTVWEKDVTIAVGEMLERHLVADPRFEVRLTRREDVYVGLRERTERASQMAGDLFISLHCNAVEGAAARRRAKGFEIWIWNREGSRNAAARAIEKLENADPGISTRNDKLLTSMMLDALEGQALVSRRVAEAVHGAFMGHPYFKANDRGIESARFTVLEVYDMPSILVELGFISHQDEVKKLFDRGHQALMAQLLYEGIVDYYEKTDPTFPRHLPRVTAARR